MSILPGFVSPACISWLQLLRKNGPLLAHCLLLWGRESEVVLGGGGTEWEVIAQKKKGQRREGKCDALFSYSASFFPPARRLRLIALRGRRGRCCSGSELGVKLQASPLLPRLLKWDLWSKRCKNRVPRLFRRTVINKKLSFIVFQGH